MSKTDNQRYIKRGYDLFIHYNPAWEEDLKHENHHKEGGTIPVLPSNDYDDCRIKDLTWHPVRQLDGLLKQIMPGRKTPHYSTIQKRTASLMSILTIT